jgi:hypothetical protein
VAETREEVKVQGEAEIEDVRVIVISVPRHGRHKSSRYLFIYPHLTQMNKSGASQLAGGLSVIFRL